METIHAFQFAPHKLDVRKPTPQKIETDRNRNRIFGAVSVSTACDNKPLERALKCVLVKVTINNDYIEDPID